MPLPEPEDNHEQGNRDPDDHADRREPDEDLVGTELQRHRFLLAMKRELTGRPVLADMPTTRNSRSPGTEVNPHTVTRPEDDGPDHGRDERSIGSVR